MVGKALRCLVVLGCVFGVQGVAAAQDQDTNMIVGGQEAKEGQFPWQVYVQIYDPAEDAYYKCGGSIIDSLWVVTAAHCVDSEGAKASIFYGSIDVTKSRKIDVEKIIVNEKFEGKGGYDDIALLKLSKPIIGAEDLKIGLADPTTDKNLVVPGATLFVSGWGNIWDFGLMDQNNLLFNEYNKLVDEYNRLLASHKKLSEKYDQLVELYNAEISGNAGGQGDGSSGGVGPVAERMAPDPTNRLKSREELESPKVLRYVDVENVDVQTCNKTRALNGLGPVGDNQICATGPMGGKDACYGDSGGPLVVKSADGKSFIQVGIVGAGGQCGNPTTPGTYARVASFYDWVQDKLKNN